MELKVPLSSLSIKDDDETLEPEVGDEVKIPGTVKEIHAGVAVINVDGSPVTPPEPETKELSRDDLLKALEEHGNAPL